MYCFRTVKGVHFLNVVRYCTSIQKGSPAHLCLFLFVIVEGLMTSSGPLRIAAEREKSLETSGKTGLLFLLKPFLDKM